MPRPVATGRDITPGLSGRDSVAMGKATPSASAACNILKLLIIFRNRQEYQRSYPRHKIPAVRRFPPPWSVEKTTGGHFRIADANGVTLAYVYVRDERSTFDGLTEDEARRIAANIARLPELLLRKF